MDNALIAARILAMVQSGISPREAFDTVLGAGTYDQLMQLVKGE